MKKLSLFIALVLGLTLASIASADTPAPGGPFSTAFRVQNLEGTTATCSYIFYNSSGSAAFTSSVTTINPGDSMFVYTGDNTTFGSLASGSYSAVVSCDKQVAAVVNFSDANSGASHSGISTPGTTWYAPGIYDNYYNYYSNLVVQNATASTVNITVDIFASGSASPVKTQTAMNVAAYASANFEQEGLAELNTNAAYSARITATGNVAPVANIYGRGPADNQLYSYNPFAAGATKFYAPIIMNNYYGNNTSLTIQNIGALTATVTITYTGGTVKNTTIGPNAADARYTPAEGVPSGDVSGLLGATIQSTNGQPIVVLVNMSNAYNRAASYNAFSGGTATVRIPIAMKRYYTYNTSTVCQNIGTASTTMTLVYGGVGGSDVSSSVAPGATYQFYQPNSSLIGNGFIGSATITASGAQPIVCVVNEDANEAPQGTQIADFQYSYNAINN